MAFFEKAPLFVLMFMIMLISLVMKTIMIENKVLINRSLGFSRPFAGVYDEEEEEEDDDEYEYEFADEEDDYVLMS